MDFAALIKKSFDISWNNRVLWLFGFLSAGVSGVGMINPSGFNFSLPSSRQTSSADVDTSTQMIRSFGQFIGGISQETLILIVLTILLVVLLFIMLGIFVVNWSGSALVFSILQRNKQRPDLKAGAKAGLKYWWKYYLVTLVFSLIVFVFILMLAIPVILLLISGMKVLAVASVIFALLLLIVFVFAISIIGSVIIVLAQRMIIHKGTGVLESIRLSGGLIKKYLGDSILTWLLAVGLSFGVGFVVLFALLPIGAVLVVLFIVNVWIGLAALVPALALLFAAAGFWYAFQAAYWTLFYEHLVAKEGS